MAADRPPLSRLSAEAAAKCCDRCRQPSRRCRHRRPDPRGVNARDERRDRADRDVDDRQVEPLTAAAGRDEELRHAQPPNGASRAGGGYNCGQGDNALQGPGIVATDKGMYVMGGTRAAGAASARLDNSDGSQTTASVVAVAPIAPGLRVYILTAPPSAHPQSIEVLDAAGTVIESAAVGN